LLLLFNNCGKGFTLTDQDSLLLMSNIDNEPWPVVNCSAPVSAKPQVEEQTATRQHFPEEFKNVIFNEDDNLLVTVNNECYQKFGPLSILTEALSELTPNASMTTYRYPIYEEISGLEIYREMLGDVCITEVDRDYTLKLFNSPPSDPLYSNQRFLASINHSFAFAQGYNSNNGIVKEVRVAVIDSGVDVNHPDLTNMILRANGQVVGLNGISPSNPDISDSGYHGTHVAGIIAAQAQNNQGVSGTAGQFIKLMPVRTSNDGVSISDSAVTNGIRWAADQGARVINLSLGGPRKSQAWLDAIQYAVSKGALVVAASGNDGCQLNPNTNCVAYPAMFTTESTGMLTVGSFDVTSGGLSRFSNYSSTFVDILAPGSDGTNGILSTVPTYRSPTGYASRSGRSPIHGTSMAAPVVSGAAAMVIGLAESRGFKITPEQVKLFFTRGSIERSDMSGYSIRGKRLDLKRLLDAVADDTGLPISSSLDRSQAAGRVEIASHSKRIGLPSGSTLELEVEKTSDSAILVNYEWLKDGHVIQGQQKSRLVINNLRLSDKGIYQARLSSGKTQRLTKPIKVNVANCN